MTTAADWITETEAHLNVRNKPLDKLAVAVTDVDAATITLTYNPGDAITEGAILGVDLELLYVWAFDTSTLVATVERGFAGSTRATHLINTLVYINPTYSKYDIFRALNQDLASLGSEGLFAMSTVDLTFSSATAAYDLTSVTNLESIYRVDAKYPGLTRDWERVRRYQIARNQNTTDFPSGFALTLLEGGSPGYAVRVSYKSGFTALTSLSSTKVSTNLPASAYDIPPLGAAARLVSPREVARNETGSQGDTRRSEEVPAGAVRASAAGLWAIRQQRVGIERAELARRYPRLAA